MRIVAMYDADDLTRLINQDLETRGMGPATTIEFIREGCARVECSAPPAPTVAPLPNALTQTLPATRPEAPPTPVHNDIETDNYPMYQPPKAGLYPAQNRVYMQGESDEWPGLPTKGT